jgi:hypothetical protein
MSIVADAVDQAQLDLVNGTIPVLYLTYPFEAGVHSANVALCFSTSPTVKRVGQGSRSHVDVAIMSNQT